MSDDQQLKNFEMLLSILEQKKIPFHKVEDKPCLTLSTLLEEKEGGLYIQWEPIEGLVQFIHALPLVVPKTHRPKMAILLNRLNLSLPVSGLAVNEENGSLSHHFFLLLDKDKSIAFNMILSHIDLSIRLAKDILPQLHKTMASTAEPGISSLFENCSMKK